MYKFIQQRKYYSLNNPFEIIFNLKSSIKHITLKKQSIIEDEAVLEILALVVVCPPEICIVKVIGSEKRRNAFRTSLVSNS